MYQIFGIRHHGPGSARSLKRALQNWQADCILIETPADAAPALAYLEGAKIQFPIALLVYNPKNFAQAAYLPYARFSPEWIAMEHAKKNDVPVQFIDLPMSMQYGVQATQVPNLDLFQDKATNNKFNRDPIGQIAQLAGYADSERWWEVTFEQHENEIAIFEEIQNMMRALRTQLNRTESLETLRREAFMRKTLRKAIKDGYERIAVICGAWHAPALEDLKAHPIKTDNTLLKGIKKVKTAVTWIPWTYERLSFQSGYGAGVISPAWYELLYRREAQATIRWMVRAARLLRKENLDASAAHALEGVRLAETLATLRDLSLPGIDELKEAAVTVICEGSEEQLQTIERALIIGDKIGKFQSDNLPIVPLQKDIEQAIRSARLTKYRKTSEVNWLKSTSTNPRGGIDLREESDRLKSQLLHRFLILNIPWGEVQKEGKYDTGSFKEYWKLKWKPEFEIRIIEASIWGNTIEQAATRSLQKQAQDVQTVSAISPLVEQALNANLPSAAHYLIGQLRDLTAVSKDILSLVDALPSLVRIIQYGDARETNTNAVQELVDELLPRICLGFPPLCTQLDDEASEEILAKLRLLNQSIHSLQREQYRTLWYLALERIIDIPVVHPEISGACSRILFEKRVQTESETSRQMYFMLSSGMDSKISAQWLEGFLYGSGLLLIHHPSLWSILDDWVRKIAAIDFQESLPLLRRAFSAFSAPERTKLLELAQHGKLVNARKESILEEADIKEVETVVRTLLG